VINPNTGLKLSTEDVAVFSRMHDIAISRCLYFKNKQAALFEIGSISVTNGDLVVASIAPALALAGAKAGPTALAAGLSAIFANQLKSFVGLPNPGTDFTPVVSSMDYIYSTYTTSPGIASMMNDSTTGKPLRTEAIKEYRIAFEQICVSSLKLPTTTTSVYQAKPVATTVVTPVAATTTVP
jgi:hypothetical protein